MIAVSCDVFAGMVFHLQATEGVLAYGAKRGAKHRQWQSHQGKRRPLQGEAFDSAVGTAACDFMRYRHSPWSPERDDVICFIQHGTGLFMVCLTNP